MLKVRVIPSLLLSSHGLVKGISFNSGRRIGTLLPAVRVYARRDVDELVLLDVNATREKRGPDVDSVKEIVLECAFPLAVGGGITSISQIRSLLLAGADKVIINSASYNDISLISEAARKFGAQCIVAGVDFRKVERDGYRCFSQCGSVDTGRNPIEWCQALQSAGAGEILLTSIDRDGTMSGYEIPLIKEVCSTLNIPVIACGGAGKLDDFPQAVEAGAAAVSAASIFHFTEVTPLDVKRSLRAAGFKVRKSTQD